MIIKWQYSSLHILETSCIHSITAEYNIYILKLIFTKYMFLLIHMGAPSIWFTKNNTNNNLRQKSMKYNSVWMTLFSPKETYFFISSPFNGIYQLLLQNFITVVLSIDCNQNQNNYKPIHCTSAIILIPILPE